MIDIFKQKIADKKSVVAKQNMLKELLQICCLKIMFDSNMFEFAAFLGGTALRILFDLRRYSEDLDFSLKKSQGCDIEKVDVAFRKGFNLMGLDIKTKVKRIGAVQSVKLKFPGLLYELGLSPLKDQVLMIKWDIDTNPPGGAVYSNKIIDNMFMFNVCHYDLSSLFAGKLHACFFRPYVKGRDWYDLVWYLNKGVSPNLELLNNAIRQTEEIDLNLSESDFRHFLRQRVESADLSNVVADVKVFLEDEKEAALITKENILSLVQ